MSNIQYARNTQDIEQCWEPVQALRPHLEKAGYITQVLAMMQEGYQLLYIQENGHAVAIAGFREVTDLVSGHHIYIDDLSTLPEARGKGYGSSLLDFIHQLAKEKNMTTVFLDSGYERNDAHRLYLSKGYNLAAHHFSNKRL